MSSTSKISFIVLNALIGTTGTLLMRHGGKNLDFSQGLVSLLAKGWLWFVGMGICWIAGVVFAVLLTRLSIIDSTSLYIPVTQTLVTIGGYFFLGEQLSGLKIVGVCIIIIGMIILLNS